MSDLGPLAPVAPTPATTPATPVVTPQQGNTQTPAGVPAAATPEGQTGQGGVSGQPQPQTPSPASVLNDAASEIGASASELAKGGQISAQVVARDNATLLVRTAAGNTLALGNLANALQQANIAVLNAALRLQLNPENPQQATVVSANGTALQPPLAALAQPPTAAQLALAVSPPQPAGTTAAPVLPQSGQVLTAAVVTPPAAAQAGNAPVLPPGSQLQVVVQSVTLPSAVPPAAVAAPAIPQPAAPAVPPAAVAVPAAAAPAVPALPNVPSAPVASSAVSVLAQAQSLAPSVPVQLPSQSPVAGPALASASPSLPQPSVTVPPASASVPQAAVPQAAVPPAPLPPALLQAGIGAAAGQPPPTVQPQNFQPANVLAPSLAGQVITGVVTGQGQAGQVLVTTPQGVLSLNLPQPLPAGTQLSFELAALTRPPAPAPTALGPAPLAGVLTRLQGEWPALQQTLDAVRAADPALAQRLQTELLPQPNVRLAATALQFMAAAAAGNAQAWLGRDAVRRLEQEGKGELLKKLDDDFRELGRLNQRKDDNDWQALVMPMFIGGRIEPVQIFMRRRKDPKKQQKQTRFIIDFNLESTGPIQFDGFVSVKQLDLILRSETEFGPAFRLDVSAIFEEAMAITGMVGSIRFLDREKPLAWPSPELDAKGPSTEIRA